MLALTLGRGNEAEDVMFGDAVYREDGDDLRLAARERACLVEDDCVEAGGLLDRDRILEQDATARAEAGPRP